METPRVDTIKPAELNNNNIQTNTPTAEPQNNLVTNDFRDSQIGNRLFHGDLFRLQLNARYDNPGTGGNPPPPIDQRKVDDAVNTIQTRLSEGALDWDVTHGDLRAIENKLRTLNRDELNAVFDRLSPGELNKWMSELNGTLGGYSANEKKALFDHLARNLNANHLARLAEATGLGPATSPLRAGDRPEPDINILARSIAQNAPDSVKADFVKALAGKANRHMDAGVAAAQVLASMRDNPALLQQTLGNLSDPELKAIVDGAARQTVVNTRGGAVVNYDPEPLRDLLNAAANMRGEGSANIKAKLFDLAGNKITEIRDNAKRFGIYYGQGAENTLRSGMTNLINSDTTGVVTRLERTNNAKGLTAYLKSMVNGGEADKVREMIARLTRGNGLNEDPAARIEQNFGTAEKPIYQNARTLGFFAGAVFSATKQISDDVTKQADIIKNLFGVAFGAGGAANPGAGVAGALANGLTAEAARAIVDGINNRTKDLRQALLELTLPPDASGDPYSGVAKDAYNASFSATALQNGFE